MTSRSTAHLGSHESIQRLSWLASSLLVIVFIAGGGSRDSGPADVVAQLLSIALLIGIAWTTSDGWVDGWARVPALPRWGVVGLIVLCLVIPALGLIPLPEALWAATSGRKALFADLASMGVSLTPRWSMGPAASEAALWMLLPPLALLLAALQMEARLVRKLLRLLIWLVLGSAVLAFLQLGAPQESVLNPFPEWQPAFGGIFSNPNHQAVAFLVAALLCASFCMDRLRAGKRWLAWSYAVCAFALIVLLPLTASRSVATLTVIVLPAWLILARPWVVWGNSHHAHGGSRVKAWRYRMVVGALVVVVVSGLLLALNWMKVDIEQEVRSSFASITLTLAKAQLPWGSGVGSFVPVFEQKGYLLPIESAYVNHAHNEYAQWLLEGGVLAAAAILLGVLLMCFFLVVILRTPSEDHRRPRLASVWLAMLALLAVSYVDFPLRTQAMSSVMGLLLGAWLREWMTQHGD